MGQVSTSVFTGKPNRFRDTEFETTNNEGNVKRSFNMSELEHSIHPSLLLRSATRGAALHLSCYDLVGMGFVFRFAFVVSPRNHPSPHIYLYIHHHRDVNTLYTIYNTTHRKTSFFHCSAPRHTSTPKHSADCGDMTSRYVCICWLSQVVFLSAPLWMVPAVSQGTKTPGKNWPVRPGVGHSIGLDQHTLEIKQD